MTATILIAAVIGFPVAFVVYGAFLHARDLRLAERAWSPASDPPARLLRDDCA